MLGNRCGRLERAVQFVDQQPRAPIRHSKTSGRSRDRTVLPHGFKKRYLARPKRNGFCSTNSHPKPYFRSTRSGGAPSFDGRNHARKHTRTRSGRDLIECDTVNPTSRAIYAMSDTQTLLTCVAFLIVALLYASAGQAGASGYIAIMALVGYEPDSIKPTALVLNILVSLIVSWRFVRDGHFNWPLFWPFALPAVPMALLGGYITLQKTWFEYLLGVLLLVAGTLSLTRKPLNDQAVRPPRKHVALVWGATIGLAAGLTGVGGGVLIMPLLLFCRWSTLRAAASVSGLFILCNSIAALAGNWSATQHLPHGIGRLALMVVVGSWLGGHLGSRWLSPRQVHVLLGVVLIIASLKLLLPI